MERTEYIVKSKEGYISEQALFALLFLEMTRVLPAPLARLVARCWPCSIHPVVGTTCRLRDRMHTRNYAIVSIYTIGGYGEVPFILSEGIPSVPFRFIVTVVCPLLFAAAAATASDFHPHYSTISPSSGIIIRSVGNVTVLHCWKAVPPRTEEHHSTSGVAAAQGWRTGCEHWI